MVNDTRVSPTSQVAGRHQRGTISWASVLDEIYEDSIRYSFQVQEILRFDSRFDSVPHDFKIRFEIRFGPT